MEQAKAVYSQSQPMRLALIVNLLPLKTRFVNAWTDITVCLFTVFHVDSLCTWKSWQRHMLMKGKHGRRTRLKLKVRMQELKLLACHVSQLFVLMQ